MLKKYSEKVCSLQDKKAIQERLVNLLVREMIDLHLEDFEQLLADSISSIGLGRNPVPDHPAISGKDRYSLEGRSYKSHHGTVGQQHLPSEVAGGD